jgi:hypothetical protein
VNATDGRPSSIARSHEPAIEPVTVSQDHSVWT